MKNIGIQSIFYKELMDFYKPKSVILKSIITKIIIKIKIKREFGYSYADITLPRFSGAVYIEKNSNFKIKI